MERFSARLREPVPQVAFERFPNLMVLDVANLYARS